MQLTFWALVCLAVAIGVFLAAFPVVSGLSAWIAGLFFVGFLILLLFDLFSDKRRRVGRHGGG